MARQLHLAGFQIYSNVVHAHAQWRNPASDPDFLTAKSYKETARTLERGKFDFVFFADALTVHGQFGNGIDDAVRTGAQATTGLDPLLLAGILGDVTEHLGIAVTRSTTYYQPFDLARSFATLDHLTSGRIGWNIVTSFSDFEARNFGVDSLIDRADRYDRADEFLELAVKLWESWESDALVQNKETGEFADPEKVHKVLHRGRYFSSEGPLTVPRSPQVRPVFVQAGASPRGRRFGSRWADVVFEIDSTIKGRKAFYENVKSLVSDQGRNPEEVKILPAFLPFVAETEDEAREKLELHNSLADPVAGLVNFSGHIGIDLAQFDLDQPIANFETNGIEGLLALARALAEDGKLTLRDLGRSYAESQLVPQIAGTGAQIADQLEEYFRDEQADGFVISPAHAPGSFDDFVDLVVPELQRRGIFRSEYTGSTFRDNLGIPQ